jgi:hypothetical protein
MPNQNGVSERISLVKAMALKQKGENERHKNDHDCHIMIFNKNQNLE